MSAAESAAAKATATAAGAVELTAESLQWMLLRAAAKVFAYGHNPLPAIAARGTACDVWLNAYDAAPDAVRQSLTHSVMATAAANAWAPAIRESVTAGGVDVTDVDLDTPLNAWVMATGRNATADASARLCRVVQRCGLIASADRRVMARALLLGTCVSPSAFAVLIADPNADAALPGPTRCSAGDAHNPPRHHSVRRDDERVTVHDVLRSAAGERPAAWGAISDARLPFGARAMAEEWAYELTGPCGCAGEQRIRERTNPLRPAITHRNDEAGEWLALRLPPNRLNARDGHGQPPLIAALRSPTGLPLTVASLLARVPDIDLTLRTRASDDERLFTAAEWATRFPRQWLLPHLAAELNLKTQQFGAQYLPSAAVLCVEALCGAVSLPRELVRLVLQYTALPQPNPWPNAHTTAAAAQRSKQPLRCTLM